MDDDFRVALVAIHGFSQRFTAGATVLQVEVTWKDRIMGIPYDIGYYLTKPILWLIYQVWGGIRDAKEDVWG